MEYIVRIVAPSPPYVLHSIYAIYFISAFVVRTHTSYCCTRKIASIISANVNARREWGCREVLSTRCRETWFIPSSFAYYIVYIYIYTTHLFFSYVIIFTSSSTHKRNPFSKRPRKALMHAKKPKLVYTYTYEHDADNCSPPRTARRAFVRILYATRYSHIHRASSSLNTVIT